MTEWLDWRIYKLCEVIKSLALDGVSVGCCHCEHLRHDVNGCLKRLVMNSFPQPSFKPVFCPVQAVNRVFQVPVLRCWFLCCCCSSLSCVQTCTSNSTHYIVLCVSACPWGGHVSAFVCCLIKNVQGCFVY